MLKLTLDKLRIQTPLLLVLLISLIARVYYAFRLEGISGGDFFDFLLITKQLVSLKNPFISKRLPFYPLLLIPGHLVDEPLIWAKILGIVFGVLSVYILYLLGRRLKINKRALYLALILFSFQGYVFIFSLKPLTHTLFNLEVLLSLYLFYLLVDYSNNRTRRVKNSKSAPLAPTLGRRAFGLRIAHLLMLFGIVLGIMSMTRLEGFIVSALLLPLLFIYILFLQPEGLNLPKPFGFKGPVQPALRSLLTAFLPFFLIVAPFFISNMTRYGSPLYTEYYEDPGVYRATDVSSLKENFETTKWIILGLWGDVPIFPIKKILIPVAAILLVMLLFRDLKPGQKLIISKLKLFHLIWIIGLLYYWIIFSRVPFEGDIKAFANFLLASLMIIGAVKLFLDLNFRSLPLLLLVGSQTIFLMIIQPWARHLQHTYAFYALFLGLGISWLIRLNGQVQSSPHFAKATRGKNVNIILYIVVLIFVMSNLYNGLEAGVKSHNRGILDEKPIMDAAVYMRDETKGLVGFESDASWVKYYVGERSRYFTTKLEIPPENRDYLRPDLNQVEWIKENNLDYVVNYSQWDGLSVVRNNKYSNIFKLEKEFETNRDGKSYYVGVYKVIK